MNTGLVYDLRNGDCVQDKIERAGNLNKNSSSLY